MIASITHRAMSVVQGGPAVRHSQPLALPVVRGLAPAASSSTRAPRMDLAFPRVRHSSSGAGPVVYFRDWPAAQDGWNGQWKMTPEGQAARQAMLQAGASQGEVRRVRLEHMWRTGQGWPQELCATTMRTSMAIGLECTLAQLMLGQGPGLEQGLRTLAICAGDAVAEHEYDSPSLGVRLALDGAKVFITHSQPLRVKAVSDELERFKDGKSFPLRTVTPDGAFCFPHDHHPRAAREVARHLVSLPGHGPGFIGLPEGLRFKALISRNAFDCMDFHAVDAAVREAGCRLQPGGGLAFEFSHSAGRPTPASAGVRLNRIGFRDIEDAAAQAGLGLRVLWITFRRADEPAPGRDVIAARRVLPDPDGRIHPHKADAAAWSGWQAIAQQPGLKGLPLCIKASGLFLKEGKGKG